MASFAKHLSTHLYFHMERNPNKTSTRTSQPSTSGFTRSDLQLSPTSQRPRSWNKENSRELERGFSSYSSEIVPTYDDHVVVDGSPRHMSSEHRGSIIGNDYGPEDYFSYSPYLLTPDLSAKSRTRKRQHVRRYSSSSSRYELCMDDDEYVHPMLEHPRLRPPEPSSPIMDRRFLPPTPHGSRGRELRDDLASPALYPEELEQDCFIVPSHMRGRFLPVKSVSSFWIYSVIDLHSYAISNVII